MIGILGKFAAALCNHGGKRSSGIMLEMPFRRHDMGQEPV